MRHILRRYRIPLSIICGFACVLLFALLLRSYRWNSTIQGVIGSERLQFTSEAGRLVFLIFPNAQSANFPSRSWTFSNNHQRGNWRGWRFETMRPSGFEIVVPHWFFILSFTAVPSALWFPWSKRFSIRTMLVMTAIVAVVLGLGVILTPVFQSDFQTEEIRFAPTQIHFRFMLPTNWSQFLTDMRTVEFFGFGWQGTRRELLVEVPYWFLVLVGVILSFVAWMRWPDRFSRRNVLIGTTVIALSVVLIIALNR
jgi:hypothetical protein